MQPAEKYMRPDAQFTHAHMVRFQRLLSGPPQQIWPRLAEPRRIPAWYGPGTIEPRVGGRVELMAGHIRGVGTRWAPPHRLA